MPLQRLHRKPPQIGPPPLRPLLLRQLPHRPPKYPHRLPHRSRRQRHAPTPPVILTSHPITRSRIPNRPTPQIQPTHHAMSQLRHPPHQPIHPQRKVSHRHPHPPHLYLFDHRHRQPKHRILRSPLRQRLLDHLGHHLQRSSPR